MISQKFMEVLKNKWFIRVYIFITVAMFVIRGVMFAASYGGVEHDSGWYLGVARNLAEHGTYASYTNTIAQEGVGDFPSIHGRFSVQDKDGYSYFPAGVTVGPGYVVPEALILKVFGDGWWQYRAWPLIGFIALLTVLFSVIYFLGGFIALVIFQVWLWLFPQLTINYVYEAFSESIALLFLLLSFIFFYKSYSKNRIHFYTGLSGLFLAFSFLTKNLFALAGLAYGFIALWDIYYYRKDLKKMILRWIFFGVGLAFPIALYELYRYIALTSEFGLKGWEAINEDIRLTYECCGSGLNKFDIHNLDMPFILKKYTVWFEVGIYKRHLIWIYFLLLPLISIFLKREKRVLFLMLWLGATISFLWFVFVSTTGWGRHIWQGLILGMALFSISLGVIARAKTKYYSSLILGLLLLVIFLLPVLKLEKIDPKFVLDQQTMLKWNKYHYEGELQGFPSLSAFPLKDQQSIAKFFEENIKKEDRVYYEAGFLVSELSPIVDHVFFPLGRYIKDNYQNPNGGKSYLIFGPYQKGPLIIVASNYVDINTVKYCQKVVYSNLSYQLCTLRNDIL